ncbi:hypothetical protein K440DRAFT_639600 [Wilcoxina mikolae CBS 423.85]|nr:hypothetical protein K440DRAFT_639600 [Wilcoxina mikolae CBS 423.85]
MDSPAFRALIRAKSSVGFSVRKTIGLIKFRGFKKRQTDPKNTSFENYLIKMLSSYPIATQISRYLTHRDLLNLAACCPAVSAMMWSEVEWVEPEQNPARVYVDLNYLEELFYYIDILAQRFNDLRSEQIKAKENFQSCFFFGPNDLQNLKELEQERDNIQFEYKKLKELPNAFEFPCPPLLHIHVGTRLGGRPRDRVEVPLRRSSSLPPRKKPDQSIIVRKLSDHQRAVRSRLIQLKSELDLVRLKSLRLEFDGASSTDADIYLVEGARIGSYLAPLFLYGCKCRDRLLHTCLDPGIRMAGGLQYTEEIWKKQFYEPRPLKNQRLARLETSTEELDFLIWKAENGGWDGELSHRVACIINTRMTSPRFPKSDADLVVRTYWQALERYTSECACCHSNNTQIVADAENIRALAHHEKWVQVADIGWQQVRVYMIERRQGTAECWGCKQIFCKVCLVTVFIWHPAIPGSERIFRPLYTRIHLVNRHMAGGWATHTLVCIDCFLEFFTGNHVDRRLYRKVKIRRPNCVGEEIKMMKVSDLGCSWAMCWGRAPWLEISDEELTALLGTQPLPCKGYKATAAGVCHGWEVFGSGDLAIGMWRGLYGID